MASRFSPCSVRMVNPVSCRTNAAHGAWLFSASPRGIDGTLCRPSKKRWVATCDKARM